MSGLETPLWEQRVTGSERTGDALPKPAAAYAESAAPSSAPTCHHRIQVRVRDLSVLADVGINPDEVGRRQPLVINVELTLAASLITSIDNTIDYRRIAKIAESLAEGHIPLIEMFARKLAMECMALGEIVRAVVKIDKPFALANGLAGVEVTVTRTPAPG